MKGTTNQTTLTGSSNGRTSERHGVQYFAAPAPMYTPPAVRTFTTDTAPQRKTSRQISRGTVIGIGVLALTMVGLAGAAYVRTQQTATANTPASAAAPAYVAQSVYDAQVPAAARMPELTVPHGALAVEAPVVRAVVPQSVYDAQVPAAARMPELTVPHGALAVEAPVVRAVVPQSVYDSQVPAAAR